MIPPQQLTVKPPQHLTPVTAKPYVDGDKIALGALSFGGLETCTGLLGRRGFMGSILQLRQGFGHAVRALDNLTP